MQVEIRRISIRSAFKLAMILYGLIGFLVGLVLAVAATVEVPPGTEPNLLTRLGFWVIPVFPIVYGLAGGFTAAVAVALYNAGASLVGGLRIDLPTVQESEDGLLRGHDVRARRPAAGARIVEVEEGPGEAEEVLESVTDSVDAESRTPAVERAAEGEA
jgi:hypothetical protein